MSFRARARAIARRRDPKAWPPWLLLMVLTLAAAMFGLAQFSGAARSQTQSAQTKEAPGHGDVQTQPPAAGVTKVTPGVLKPKTNPDPEMALPTPNPKEFPTPVIKPPGTAGNQSPVVPR